MLIHWIGLAIVLLAGVEAQFNCNLPNVNDTLRQKILDYHNGFRGKIALGQAVNYNKTNFIFPTGQNMYKVSHNCELERLANSRASICTWKASTETVAAGATVVGGYYKGAAVVGGNYPPEIAYYNVFRQWLWEFYKQINSTTALTKDNGLQGATFLYKYNIEVGCAIKQNCWIDGVKMQAVVCAYHRTATIAPTAYERGPACQTNDNCTIYPGVCDAARGMCSLKTKPAPYGQLSVNGSKLVGKDGKPVALHGMALFGTNNEKGLPFYKNEVIQKLKCNWNTNAFRATLVIGDGQGEGYIRTQRDFPNKYHDKQRVDTVIKAAIQHGIYVVIDWHGQPATMETFLPQAKDYWQYVSERYGFFPHIIYETFNEPFNRTWDNHIKPYHNAVIPSIRKFDKKNVIILGTQDYSGRPDLAAANPVNLTENLCYTLHFYSRTNISTTRAQHVDATLNKGLCVFVTEYGVSDSNGQTGFYPENTQGWWKFLDDRKISYLNWALQTHPIHTTAALVNNTLPSEIDLDTKLSRSGQLVKAQYKSQNNGVVC